MTGGAISDEDEEEREELEDAEGTEAEDDDMLIAVCYFETIYKFMQERHKF